MWSLLLVLGLHLLSTSGTWWITDHGEILAVAEHFSKTGRFDLEGLGPLWKDWEDIARARHSTSTRFLPLSVLALTPLLAVDHALWGNDPASFRAVHLQGHLFVMIGLLVLGRSIVRASGNPSIAALAVLLAGLSWPVWMIARRMGPEPILFALLAVFVTGGRTARIAVLIVLPWVHATGPLLGLGALLWLATDRTGSWKPAAVAWAIGVATVTFLWNRPIHQTSLLGGYGAYAENQGFSLRNPLSESLPFLATIVAWMIPLCLLTLRGGRRTVIESVALALPIVAFLGLLFHPALLPYPEAERRLAPLVAAWAAIALSRTSTVSPRLKIALVSLSLATGLFGLSGDFAAVVATPLGPFSGPHLLLLRLAFVEGHPGLATVLGVALLTLFLIAARRTLRLLLHPEGATPASAA